MTPAPLPWSSAQARWSARELRGEPQPTAAVAFILLASPSSEEMSRLAARKYARIIQKLGFPVSLVDCSTPSADEIIH